MKLGSEKAKLEKFERRDLHVRNSDSTLIQDTMTLEPVSFISKT
jgi:hypothetical protein